MVLVIVTELLPKMWRSWFKKYGKCAGRFKQRASNVRMDSVDSVMRIADLEFWYLLKYPGWEIIAKVVQLPNDIFCNFWRCFFFHGCDMKSIIIFFSSVVIFLSLTACDNRQKIAATPPPICQIPLPNGSYKEVEIVDVPCDELIQSAQSGVAEADKVFESLPATVEITQPIDMPEPIPLVVDVDVSEKFGEPLRDIEQDSEDEPTIVVSE